MYSALLRYTGRSLCNLYSGESPILIPDSSLHTVEAVLELETVLWMEALSGVEFSRRSGDRYSLAFQTYTCCLLDEMLVTEWELVLEDLKQCMSLRSDSCNSGCWRQREFQFRTSKLHPKAFRFGSDRSLCSHCWDTNQ